MKRFLLLALMFAFSACFCTTTLAKTDYGMLYENAQKADFEFMNGIDPFQIEEYYKYAWAPYPLIRTSSVLYFKDIKIEPGYYLLTHRNYKGADWLLFKEAGKVKYIIPVVETQFVPETFYKTRIPIPKQTKWQKFCKNFSNGFYTLFKKSKKQPPPKAYIETKEVQGNYHLIILYFGSTAYYAVFRNSQY